MKNHKPIRKFRGNLLLLVFRVMELSSYRREAWFETYNTWLLDDECSQVPSKYVLRTTFQRSNPYIEQNTVFIVILQVCQFEFLNFIRTQKFSITPSSSNTMYLDFPCWKLFQVGTVRITGKKKTEEEEEDNNNGPFETLKCATLVVSFLFYWFIYLRLCVVESLVHVAQ
jgi:hypothetical protein